VFRQNKLHLCTRNILQFIMTVSLGFVVAKAEEDVKTFVAVMDLRISGGIPESYQGTLSDRLRMELHNTGRFNVVERNAMDTILEEQGLQLSGCTSDECAIEMGRLLGVERMIAGTVGRIGQSHSVILR